MRTQEFDFSVDVLSAVLWRYDDAPHLLSLLRQKGAWYETNQAQFWRDWHRDVFDLTTANDFGMQVWARILGVPLSVPLPASARTKPTWGFGEFNENWNNANFSRDTEASATLTIDQRRLVLRMRYFQLIARGTVPETNRFLATLFGSQGSAYILDPQDMTMTVVFTFQPSSELAFILEEYDLIPRPAGVGARYEVIADDVFGVGENNKSFDNATFIAL